MLFYLFIHYVLREIPKKCSESSLGLQSPQSCGTHVDAPQAITVGTELPDPLALARV